MRRAIGGLVAGIVLIAAAAALSETPRRFSIDDLLAQESFGNIRISPDGRWIVSEQAASWSTAATYRFGASTQTLLTRLTVYSPESGQQVHALADPDHGSGFKAGPFSPRGDRMVVYRLSEDAWTLGVMTLTTGTVDWLDVNPEVAAWGQTVSWRSDKELLVVARPPGTIPFTINVEADATSRITDLWRRAGIGRSSSSVFIPSGVARNARRHDPSSKLLLVDLSTGGEQTLLNGPIIDFATSPDKASLAVVMDGDDLQIGPTSLASTGAARRLRRLFIIDMETRRASEPLSGQDFASHLLSWSPDSTTLLAFARDKGGDFADGRFWAIDRRGPMPINLHGARPWLDDDPQHIPVARAGWVGNEPAVQVRAADGYKSWLVAPRRGPPRIVREKEAGEMLVRFDGAIQIARSDGLYGLGATKATSGLTGRLIGTGDSIDFGARGTQNPNPGDDGGSVLFGADGCVRPSDRSSKCGFALDADETVRAASPTGAFLVTQVRSPRGSMTLQVRTPTGSRILSTINTFLDEIDWGEVTPVDHPGPDDQRLRSWLLMPPNWTGGSAPLVVIVYPGSEFAVAPPALSPGYLGRHINPAVFSAKGYAVLMASLPARRSDPGDWSDLGPRLEAIVAAACATGHCDADRAALVGHSFGGYGVLLAATQTHHFRAIVASNGYADLSQGLAIRLGLQMATGKEVVTSVGWLESGQGNLGATLAAAPNRYVSRSPLYAVGKIETPTLLIQSDLDGSRLSSLFGALYRDDKEAELVTYYGEGHEFSSPANLRDLHLRIFGWLDRYLQAPGSIDAGLPMLDPEFEEGEDEKSSSGGIPD